MRHKRDIEKRIKIMYNKIYNYEKFDVTKFAD